MKMINILLIDSDPLFQKAFLKIISAQKNCEIAGIAETQKQAMELLQNIRPQIVFMDITLQKENDSDICQKIKKRCPETNLYFLSSYCDFRLMQKAMQIGVDGYFFKPVSRLEICTVIDSCKQEEKQEKNQDVEELLMKMSQRNYKDSLNIAKDIVNKITKEKSLIQRREKLMMVAMDLFSVIPEMQMEQKKYYIQKYQLSSLILKRETLCCNWMIQFITEIFCMVCVSKYPYMNRVFSYIEENIDNEISLTELSEKAGISSGYLSRVFKKYYQISLVDYIHLRKIHMAKYYMISSEMNISDISFMLGYSEAGYFCKIFKKYEGMTPSGFYHKVIKNESAV